PQDSGFNGVNLVYGGSLNVIFNEQSTSSLTIAGVKFDSVGLGLGAAGNTFQTTYDINAAMTQLQTALSSLQTQASAFGSNLSIMQNRQDFTKNDSNTLHPSAEH